MTAVKRSAVLDPDAGGDGGSGGDDTWTLIRPDLGLFAAATPVGWSSLAATTFLSALARAAESDSSRPGAGESNALATFRTWILGARADWDAMAAGSRELRRVGAAVAAMRILGSDAVVARIGDARIVKVREARIVDQVLADAGERSAPGTSEQGELDPSTAFGCWRVGRGDAFALLAGVHRVIRDVEIIQALSNAPSPRAVSQLSEIARARQPGDHFTAVCCHLR